MTLKTPPRSTDAQHCLSPLQVYQQRISERQALLKESPVRVSYTMRASQSTLTVPSTP
jgi:hypothetical protein